MVRDHRILLDKEPEHEEHRVVHRDAGYQIWPQDQYTPVLWYVVALLCRDRYFIHPNGELGFALHEMYEVLGVALGESPYEEYSMVLGNLIISPPRTLR